VKSWLGRIGLSTRVANPEVGSGVAVAKKTSGSGPARQPRQRHDIAVRTDGEAEESDQRDL
jgi:hypothetical protein